MLVLGVEPRMPAHKTEVITVSQYELFTSIILHSFLNLKFAVRYNIFERCVFLSQMLYQLS